MDQPVHCLMWDHPHMISYKSFSMSPQINVYTRLCHRSKGIISLINLGIIAKIEYTASQEYLYQIDGCCNIKNSCRVWSQCQESLWWLIIDIESAGLSGAETQQCDSLHMGCHNCHLGRGSMHRPASTWQSDQEGPATSIDSYIVRYIWLEDLGSYRYSESCCNWPWLTM